MVKETDLYQPIKNYFTSLGYEVKAEINDCDIIAFRNNEPPIIVELKIRFSLDLILQGIQRLSISERVYIASFSIEKKSRNSIWNKRKKQILNLCKRVGLGLIRVQIETGDVTVLIEPTEFIAKSNTKRRKKVLNEFKKRQGDPNIAGSSKKKIITAYRQDALRCAIYLNSIDNNSLKNIRDMTSVQSAGSILQKNYYGWFDRVSRGVYRLSSEGKKGIQIFRDALPSTKKTD